MSPAGSPIDLWWRSHEPVVVTTNAKQATHYFVDSPRVAVCGHRKGTATNMRELVTCSACWAAMRADA